MNNDKRNNPGVFVKLETNKNLKHENILNINWVFICLFFNTDDTNTQEVFRFLSSRIAYARVKWKKQNEVC